MRTLSRIDVNRALRALFGAGMRGYTRELSEGVQNKKQGHLELSKPETEYRLESCLSRYSGKMGFICLRRVRIKDSFPAELAGHLRVDDYTYVQLKEESDLWLLILPKWSK